MEMESGTSQKLDPLEQALALLEKEQREFEGHWIWEKLNCKPREFFQAFRRHAEALPVAKDQWERAYQKARDEILIKAKERASQSPDPAHFGGLKV